MIKLILLSVLVAGIISGCAGSPARMSGQTVNEIIDDLNLDKVSLQELCQRKTYFIGRLLRNVENQPTWDHSGLKQGIRAVDLELTRRGHDKRYCEGGSYAAKKTPTEARQLRGPTPSVSGQGTENYQKGEIAPDEDINKKVRFGQSRLEAVGSIGDPAEITKLGGVVATSYCQTGAGLDRYITLWFVDSRLAEVESKLEYRGLGSCAPFIAKPREGDIPQKLRPKRIKDTRTYSNGATYSGEFRNGVFDGSGEMTFANGDKFVGQYVNGYQDGRGQTFNSQGNLIFEAHYKEGKANGFGIMYPVGKRSWSATWKDGKVVKETFKWLDE